MALSPIAALSLPLLQNEGWANSMRDFAERLRGGVSSTVANDSFKDWAKGVDRDLTFMDWTYKLTGIDLTYVWDPELWIKFKEAIWHDQPQLFWNELADRVEYSEMECMGSQKRSKWKCMPSHGAARCPVMPPIRPTLRDFFFSAPRGVNSPGRHRRRHADQLRQVPATAGVQPRQAGGGVRGHEDRHHRGDHQRERVSTDE